MIPLDVMPLNGVGHTFTVLRRAEGSVALGKLANILRFKLKEIDPSTGEGRERMRRRGGYCEHPSAPHDPPPQALHTNHTHCLSSLPFFPPPLLSLAPSYPSPPSPPVAPQARRKRTGTRMSTSWRSWTCCRPTT